MVPVHFNKLASLCKHHAIVLIGYHGKTHTGTNSKNGKKQRHAWNKRFAGKKLPHAPPPHSCAQAFTIRREGIQQMRDCMEGISHKKLGHAGFDMYLIAQKNLAFTNFSLAGQHGHTSGLDGVSKHSWRPQDPVWRDLKLLTYDEDMQMQLGHGYTLESLM